MSLLYRSRAIDLELDRAIAYSYTVLLEYFVGEKPLRISQISRKCDPFRSKYLRSGKDRVK